MGKFLARRTRAAEQSYVRLRKTRKLYLIFALPANQLTYSFHYIRRQQLAAAVVLQCDFAGNVSCVWRRKNLDAEGGPGSKMLRKLCAEASRQVQPRS